MQVVVWRVLCFVQFRIVKPVDFCGFITATPAALSLPCCYLHWLSAHCVMSFLTAVLRCFKGCKFSRERSNSISVVVWLMQPCAFGYHFFKFLRSRFELTAWTSCHLWSCLSMTCKNIQKLAKFSPCRTLQYCLFTWVLCCWPHTDSKLAIQIFVHKKLMCMYHQNFQFPWQVHFLTRIFGIFLTILPCFFYISCLARLYMVW